MWISFFFWQDTNHIQRVNYIFSCSVSWPILSPFSLSLFSSLPSLMARLLISLHSPPSLLHFPLLPFNSLNSFSSSFLYISPYFSLYLSKYGLTFYCLLPFFSLLSPSLLLLDSLPFHLIFLRDLPSLSLSLLIPLPIPSSHPVLLSCFFSLSSALFWPS